METKRSLNSYVFGNLIVSFLTLNIIVNPTSKVLVEKTSDNTLNKIYEEEVITIDTPDTIISSEEQVVVQISNRNTKSSGSNYNYVKPSYNSLTGNNLVNYALQFVGLPYVSAGNSLATGTDCSGFTSLIYREFGISLGRTVSSQLSSGTYVSREDLQPGDLVFYSYGSVASHVAIYIGNGLIIHESTPRDGVKISSVNIMRYITARRLITSNVGVSVQEEPKQEAISQPVETNSNTNTNSNNNQIESTTNNAVVKEEVVREEVKEEPKEEIKEETVQEKNKNNKNRKEHKTIETSKENIEENNEEN